MTTLAIIVAALCLPSLVLFGLALNDTIPGGRGWLERNRILLGALFLVLAVVVMPLFFGAFPELR